MPFKRVGLIGCGTIGSQLAIAIDNGSITNASIVSLFDAIETYAAELADRLTSRPKAYSEFEEFVDSDVDVFVEAASQDAIRKYAKHILENGKDLMIMSVGALADYSFLSELLQVASSKDSRIYLPTGAIAGIDAIRSVKEHLESVTLTTTKNPNALAGAPFFERNKINIVDLKEKVVIYEGPASEAVKAFPANVNVAAILSLAGIGASKTQVKIVADPLTDRNEHEIVATGKFGKIQIIVSNVPSPRNPKTSFLAVLSSIECLRSICSDGMRIGS
jgi:aspartate dehydrogenase